MWSLMRLWYSVLQEIRNAYDCIRNLQETGVDEVLKEIESKIKEFEKDIYTPKEDEQI